MAECRDLLIGVIIATGARVVSIPTDLGTGHGLCCVSDLIVAECRDLCIGGVIATRARVVSFPTNLGTAHSLCCVGDLIVAECRDLLIGCVIATGARIVSFPADLGTSHSLCCVSDLIVTKCRDLLVGSVCAVHTRNVCFVTDTRTSRKRLSIMRKFVHFRNNGIQRSARFALIKFDAVLLALHVFLQRFVLCPSMRMIAIRNVRLFTINDLLFVSKQSIDIRAYGLNICAHVNALRCLNQISASVAVCNRGGNGRRRYIHAFQILATVKCIGANIPYTLRDHYTCKLKTTIESSGTNAFTNAIRRKGNGDDLGIITRAGRIEQACRYLCYVGTNVDCDTLFFDASSCENRVTAGYISHCGCIKVDHSQCRTVIESILSNSRHCLRDRKTFQSSASIESSASNTRHIFRKYKFRQCNALIEGTIGNSRQAFRERDACQLGTIVEGFVINDLQLFGEHDACQSDAIIESGVTYGRYILRKCDTFQKGASIESKLAHAYANAIFLKVDLEQIRLIVAKVSGYLCDLCANIEHKAFFGFRDIGEGFSAGGKIVHFDRIKIDLAKCCTISKCITTQGLYAFRDRDACQIEVLIECVITNAFARTIGCKGNGHDLCHIAIAVVRREQICRDLRNISSNVENNTLSALTYFIKDLCTGLHVIHRNSIKIDLCERGAIVEGIIRKTCYGLRNRNACQSGTTIESTITNLSDTFGKRKIFQRSAKIECVVADTDTSAVLCERNRYDLGGSGAVRIEQIRRDLCDARAEIDRNPLTVLTQIIKHGVIACKIVHRNGIEVELGQSRTITECVVTNTRHALGDRHACQSGAISENVAADRLDAIGKRDTSEVRITVERITADTLTNTVRSKGNGNDLCDILVIAIGIEQVGRDLCNVGAEIDRNTLRIVTDLIKGHGSRSKITQRDGVEVDLGKCGTIVEGIVADARHTLGNRHNGKICTTVKCGGTNACTSSVLSKGDGCDLWRIHVATEHIEQIGRNLCDVGAKIHRNAVAAHTHIVECVSVACKIAHRDSVEVDLGKSLTTRECGLAYTGQALGKRKTCERPARVKRVIADALHALGQHDSFHQRKIGKGALANAFANTVRCKVNTDDLRRITIQVIRKHIRGDLGDLGTDAKCNSLSASTGVVEHAATIDVIHSNRIKIDLR